MNAIFGIFMIIALAYVILRLLSWAFYSWERGWWFQNPRTMKIRQPHPLLVGNSAEYAVYSQWRAINPPSNLSFYEWKNQLDVAEFVRECREQDDRDYWDRLTQSGTYSYLNDKDH
jgi:hypothetical protein